MKERKMKKILAAILAVGMIAGVASAQTSSNVFSQNAVGYVKAAIQPGEFSLLAQPFNSIDGDPTPSNVFGDTLPVGSRIFVWDPVSSTYSIETYQTTTAGLPPVTTTNWAPNAALLQPGKGFWVQISQDAGSAVDVTLMGEVPAATATTVDLVSGFTMAAVPYPVDITVEETAIGQNPTVGDRVFLWSDASQSYTIVTYQTTTAGLPPVTTTNWVPSNVSIPAGSGFWYEGSSARSPSVTKPYDWP
jgi:hypothetical protein